MSDENKKDGAFKRFMALPTDSVAKTLGVAVVLCLVASMIVSSVSVALRPVQDANKLRDKQLNILQVAGVYNPSESVTDSFKAFEPHVLDLATGEFVDKQFDPQTFDDTAAASNPDLSVALKVDPAGIGRQSKYVTIYLLRDTSGAISKVVLPIYGYGLWSTLYGYIALEADGNDIFGLQFYSQAETPGLGAEVDNPRWIAQWNGKKLEDPEGVLQINVAKKATAAGEVYHVDAIAGATLTSNGVNNLVRFWMGENGFEPFLKKLKAGDV